MSASTAAGVVVVGTWFAFLAGLVVACGYLGARLRRRRARRRDRNRELAELGWLRGMPVIAPHVIYPSESEYDADLQRMTLMGYTPVEVYRIGALRGFRYDVRYQLMDMEQFRQSARELARREHLAG